MKQLTEILPDIFVVEVPVDAEDINIKYQFLYYFLNYASTVYGIALFGEFQILGTITKDEISFDVSEFIGAENEPRSIPKIHFKMFPGGKLAAQKFNEEQWQQFSQQYFRSLLLKHRFDNYEKLVVLKKVTP